jgi:hypothetical protein
MLYDAVPKALQRISFEGVYQITSPGTASNDITKNFI